MSGRAGGRKKSRSSSALVPPPRSPPQSPPPRSPPKPLVASLRSSGSSSSSTTGAAAAAEWDRETCATLTQSGARCASSDWRGHPCCTRHYASSFSRLPAAVTGLIGGFADRPTRIATSRASRRLGATLEAICPVRSCLAPQVPEVCRGVCEQRGARLIRQAVADDPTVLREFSFWSTNDAGGGGPTRIVRFMSEPTDRNEEEEEELESDEDSDAIKEATRTDPTLRRMRLTFEWDDGDAHRTSDDELKASGDAHLEALYLADGKEARDILALIERTRVRFETSKGSHAFFARDQLAGLLRDLNAIYEHYRQPTTVGAITQQLAKLQLAANDDADVLEQEDHDWRLELRESYREVTGRRLVGLPPSAPIPSDVAWLTRTIASLFRDGSSAGWSIESTNFDEDPLRYVVQLHVTAPLADVGTLFVRLLSEPPAAFDRLVLAPVGKVSDAEKKLREGIRVWRGADLVSGTFTVADTEFHRLYPEVRREREAAAKARAERKEEAEREEKQEATSSEEPREGKEEEKRGGGAARRNARGT